MRQLTILCASLAVVLGFSAAPAFADTGDPLVYYGGPVAHSMSGVLVDWGPSVNPLYTNETSGDPGLLKSFAASSGSTTGIGGVLAQYMDSSSQNAANRVSYGQQYEIAPSVSATTVSDDQIAQELVAQIGGGHLPTPPGAGLSTVYLVLLPAGDTVCMPDGQGGSACSGQAFCAYHGSAALPNGTHVLYAVLPDNTSGGMAQGCGPRGPGTTLPDQTAYLSHEWSEAITDPLVAEANSSGPPLAWYDNACATAQCVDGEISDKCSGQIGQNNGWQVALQWSNLDQTCEATEPAYSAPAAAFTAGGVTLGAPVRADASASSDPAANATSARFAGASYAISAGIGTYAWNWGDGSAPSAGELTSHTYARAGTYQVSLTVSDRLGFSSTVTQALTVSAPVVTAPALSTITAPQTTPNTPPATSGTAAHPGTVRRPVVRTGQALVLGPGKASLSGWIGPQGTPATYHFEYGTTRRLGRSTAKMTAAAGTGRVAALLTGLRPGVRYYVRLVASDGAGTAVGASVSFRSSAARASAARLTVASVRVTGRANQLLARFTCSAGCVVHFTVLARLPRAIRAAALPITLASRSVRLPRGGAGLARLPINGIGRFRVVALTAYATGSWGARSAPAARVVTLH